MKVSNRHIDRLTVELEPGDSSYYIPIPYHPRFYIEPVKVLAEYDHDVSDVWQAIRRAEVTGQRYRRMADGTVKKVGPGRGPRADEPTVWDFPGRSSMPHGLVQLLYDAYMSR